MKEIRNAKITKVDLSMADHGVLTLELFIDSPPFQTCIGGYVLGRGYLDAKEFKGYAKGIEEIMQVMNACTSTTPRAFNRFSA